jgi:hypothetical protein
MPRTLLVAALLAAGSSIVSGAADAAVSVAAYNKVAPPPGLYRLDQDGTMRMPDADASFRQKEDGATGDVGTRTTQGGQSYDRQFKGKGPNTFCVRSSAGKPVALPPEMAAAACKNLSESATDDTIVLESQCSIGKIKLTIRKLGKDTWEYLHEGDVKVHNGAPDMNAMRPMLEIAAKNGATPEERAQAKKMLADLPRQQVEMQAHLTEAKAALLEEQANANSPEEAAAIAQALQAMEQGGPRMQTSSRTLWTRIGNSCAP